MKTKDELIKELAFQITLRRIKMGAPVIPMYKIEETLGEAKDEKELRFWITMYLDVPREILRTYKKPCSECLLTYQEELFDRCYECNSKEKQNLMRCELLSRQYDAECYICGECCSEIRLLRKGR